MLSGLGDPRPTRCKLQSIVQSKFDLKIICAWLTASGRRRRQRRPATSGSLRLHQMRSNDTNSLSIYFKFDTSPRTFVQVQPRDSPSITTIRKLHISPLTFDMLWHEGEGGERRGGEGRDWLRIIGCSGCQRCRRCRRGGERKRWRAVLWWASRCGRPRPSVGPWRRPNDAAVMLKQLASGTRHDSSA